MLLQQHSDTGQCDRNTRSPSHMQVWSPGLPMAVFWITYLGKTLSYSQLCLLSSVLAVQSRSAELCQQNHHCFFRDAWHGQSHQFTLTEWPGLCSSSTAGVVPLPSHNVPALKWQKERALLSISRAGLVLPTTPRHGQGQQINLPQTGHSWSLQRACPPCSSRQGSWGNSRSGDSSTQTLLRTSTYSQPFRKLLVYLWSLQDQIGFHL